MTFLTGSTAMMLYCFAFYTIIAVPQAVLFWTEILVIPGIHWSHLPSLGVTGHEYCMCM